MEVQRRYEEVRQEHEAALEEVQRATTAATTATASRARLYATSTNA